MFFMESSEGELDLSARRSMGHREADESSARDSCNQTDNPIAEKFPSGCAIPGAQGLNRWVFAPALVERFPCLPRASGTHLALRDPAGGAIDQSAALIALMVSAYSASERSFLLAGIISKVVPKPGPSWYFGTRWKCRCGNLSEYAP